MFIIGITGKKGSGKDETAKMIQFLLFQSRKKFAASFENYCTWKRIHGPVMTSGVKTPAFADPIKDIVVRMLGIKRESLENPEFKKSELPPSWQNSKIKTYRDLLQQIGEKMREINRDCFVNTFLNDYEHGKGLIVPDVRHLNEARAIRGEGGIIIKLLRNMENKEDRHQSETELERIKGNIEIDNRDTTLKQHFNKVSELFESFNLGKSLKRGYYVS